MILTTARFSLLFLFFFKLLCAESTSNLFWEEEINNGINQRTDFFNVVGISDDGLRINSWDNSRKEQILSHLNSFDSLSQTAWFYFLKGVIVYNNDSTSAETFFSKAIRSASADPGITWLLFFEFDRYRIFKWSEICLNQLQRQLADAGATSSILVYTQLCNIASIYERHKEKDISLNLYTWAEKFNPNQTFTIQKRFLLGFPSNLNLMRDAAISYLDVIKRSWIVELELFASVYNVLHTFLFLLMISIFFVMIIKYFPSAIHFISDLYPLKLSVSIRNILSSSLIIIPSFFNIYLFLWIIAFLIWNYLDKRDKTFFIIALLLLVTAPLDMRVKDMILNTTDPDSPLSLYKLATTEGYSEKFDKKLSASSDSNPLCLLAKSISNYKKGDLQSSQDKIEKLYTIDSKDPVTLTLAGNVFFLKDNIKDSKKLYEKVIHIDSRDISSVFNLAQCFLRQGDMLNGSDLMDKAAKTDKALVNSFIHQNDIFYSKNWPPHRKLMLPEYTPAYFWKHIFFKNNGDWNTVNRLWRTSFLGLNAYLSFLLFCGFFVFLFLISLFRSPSRIKKLFECKYCGRIVCKKCSQGILCTTCNSMIDYIKNEKKIEKVRYEIQTKFASIQIIKETVLDCIFPGTGSFLKIKKSFRMSVLLLLLSCFVYTSYICIYKIYISSGLNFATVLLLIFLLLTHFYFICNRCSFLIKFFMSNSR